MVTPKEILFWIWPVCKKVTEIETQFKIVLFVGFTLKQNFTSKPLFIIHHTLCNAFIWFPFPKQTACISFFYVSARFFTNDNLVVPLRQRINFKRKLFESCETYFLELYRITVAIINSMISYCNTASLLCIFPFNSYHKTSIFIGYLQWLINYKLCIWMFSLYFECFTDEWHPWFRKVNQLFIYDEQRAAYEEKANNNPE